MIIKTKPKQVDQYEQRINPGRFRRIKNNLSDKKRDFVKYLKGKEFNLINQFLFDIIMDGILVTVGLSIFIGFNWKLIIPLGCLTYIITTKVKDFIVSILSSFRLVENK